MSDEHSEGPSEYELGRGRFRQDEEAALRDQFAGQAMPTTIMLVMEATPPAAFREASFAEAVARLSYQMADAMLVERLAMRL